MSFLPTGGPQSPPDSQMLHKQDREIEAKAELYAQFRGTDGLVRRMLRRP